MRPKVWMELRYLMRHRGARLGVWAAAIGAVLLLAALAFWWTQRSEHARLNARLGEAYGKLRTLRQSEPSRQSFQLVRGDADRLSVKLAYAGGQAQLVRDLGRLARGGGVRVLSETYETYESYKTYKTYKTYDGGRPVAGVGTIVADWTVQGSYRSLSDLMLQAGDLPLWVEFNEVRLEAIDAQPGQIRARLRMTAFRQTTNRSQERP